MKAGKIIGIALAIIIAVVVGIIVVGIGNINAIIKQAVETVGTEVVQTPVTLNSADFTIMEGRGELLGLKVGNPKGFTTDHAVALEKIALEVDPASLTGEVIIIREVLIDGISLIAEQKGLTQNNLQSLLNNIKQQGSQKEQTQSPDSDPSNSGGEEVRLMVENFKFTNSTVTVVTEKWGEKKASLPAIELSDLGDKQTGLTPSQLAQAVISPLLEQAKKAASNVLEDKAKDKLKEKLSEKLSDEQKEKLDELKSFFKR